jgi:hypothetical protein
LEDCPPGPFLYENRLGFKSEYRTGTGKIEAFTSSGEFFVLGSDTIVQPVYCEVEQ